MKQRPVWRHVRRILSYVREVRLLFAASLVLLFLVSGLTAAKAWIIQPAVDTFVGSGATREKLLLLCGAVAGIFALQAAVGWSYAVLSQMAGTRVVARIREDLFRHLMRHDLGYFATRPSSDLTSRVVNDVAVFNYTAIGAVQDLLRSVVTLVLLLAVMFSMDWRLALLCLGILGGLGLFMRAFTRRLSVASRQVQEKLSEIVNQLTEMIGGIEVVLTFGMARRWQKRFDDVNLLSYQAYVRAQRTGATASATIGLIVGLGLATILLLTGGALLDGEITPGRFLSLLAAMYLIQTPLVGIGNAATGLARGFAAGARALELLDEMPAIRDPADPVPLPAPTGRLEFREVSFAYGEMPVVSNLSFRAEPGELVVMVGDSGAGKSTVAKLLLRCYDAGAGAVLLDGIDVRHLARESLYRAASYVPQEGFLFDGTIRFNVTVGRPDASDAEVEAATRAACLEEFVAGLPDGLATVVGERGVRLSGGQRQRIAIARAILTGAPLLILDEATSALDTDLERRLLEHLVTAPGRRTIFAISHRLSLAAIADRVLVLREGRLVEEGTAKALALRQGEYARLQRAGAAH